MSRSLLMLAARCVAVLLVAMAGARAADLRIGMSAEPSSLDPHFHNLASNNNLAAHVFETLTPVRFGLEAGSGPGGVVAARRRADLGIQVAQGRAASTTAAN